MQKSHNNRKLVKSTTKCAKKIKKTTSKRTIVTKRPVVSIVPSQTLSQRTPLTTISQRLMAVRRPKPTGVMHMEDIVKEMNKPIEVINTIEDVHKFQLQANELEHVRLQNELHKARENFESKVLRKTRTEMPDENQVKHLQFLLIASIESDPVLQDHLYALFNDEIPVDHISERKSRVKLNGDATRLEYCKSFLSDVAERLLVTTGKDSGIQFSSRKTLSMAYSNFLLLFRIYANSGLDLNPIQVEDTDGLGPVAVNLLEKNPNSLEYATLNDAFWQVFVQAATKCTPEQYLSQRTYLDPKAVRDITSRQFQIANDPNFKAEIYDALNDLGIETPSYRATPAEKVEFMNICRRLCEDLLAEETMEKIAHHYNYAGKLGFLVFSKACQDHHAEPSVNAVVALLDQEMASICPIYVSQDEIKTVMDDRRAFKVAEVETDAERLRKWQAEHGPDSVPPRTEEEIQQAKRVINQMFLNQREENLKKITDDPFYLRSPHPGDLPQLPRVSPERTLRQDERETQHKLSFSARPKGLGKDATTKVGGLKRPTTYAQEDLLLAQAQAEVEVLEKRAKSMAGKTNMNISRSSPNTMPQLNLDSDDESNNYMRNSSRGNVKVEAPTAKGKYGLPLPPGYTPPSTLFQNVDVRKTVLPGPGQRDVRPLSDVSGMLEHAKQQSGEFSYKERAAALPTAPPRKAPTGKFDSFK